MSIISYCVFQLGIIQVLGPNGEINFYNKSKIIKAGCSYYTHTYL